jgi:type I restriction enzyme M protein
MANSAADAAGSELALRRKLIEERVVDVLVSVASNFFFTVTLPCTLWFLDREKAISDRADKVLFIDARKVFRQIDRAHRDFLPQQVEFLSNIARLYRGETVEMSDGSATLESAFPTGEYQDVPGLCRVATLEDIAGHGWSLTPGRYVGVADGEDDGFQFAGRLEELSEELEALNVEAGFLEQAVAASITKLLEGK